MIKFQEQNPRTSTSTFTGLDQEVLYGIFFHLLNTPIIKIYIQVISYDIGLAPNNKHRDDDNCKSGLDFTIKS